MFLLECLQCCRTAFLFSHPPTLCLQGFQQQLKRFISIGADVFIVSEYLSSVRSTSWKRVGATARVPSLLAFCCGWVGRSCPRGAWLVSCSGFLAARYDPPHRDRRAHLRSFVAGLCLVLACCRYHLNDQVPNTYVCSTWHDFHLNYNSKASRSLNLKPQSPKLKVTCHLC